MELPGVPEPGGGKRASPKHNNGGGMVTRLRDPRDEKFRERAQREMKLADEAAWIADTQQRLERHRSYRVSPASRRRQQRDSSPRSRQLIGKQAFCFAQGLFKDSKVH